jgi:hypothetical protein
LAVLAIAALAKRSLFWYTNDIIAIAAASGVFPAFQMRREGGPPRGENDCPHDGIGHPFGVRAAAYFCRDLIFL